MNFGQINFAQQFYFGEEGCLTQNLHSSQSYLTKIFPHWTGQLSILQFLISATVLDLYPTSISHLGKIQNDQKFTNAENFIKTFFEGESRHSFEMPWLIHYVEKSNIWQAHLARWGNNEQRFCHNFHNSFEKISSTPLMDHTEKFEASSDSPFHRYRYFSAVWSSARFARQWILRGRISVLPPLFPRAQLKQRIARGMEEHRDSCGLINSSTAIAVRACTAHFSGTYLHSGIWSA